MIGIFDSGLGGLTVTREIMRQLPDYQLLYLGDTARTPYGNRSPVVIYHFTEQAVDYLFSQGCELIIIACNTASAEALRRIQQEYLPSHYPNKRVLGVIRPVAEVAAAATKKKRLGVVGTAGTVRSEVFVRELTAIDPALSVFQQSCPLLVPLVEEGWVNRPETMRIVRSYVRPFKSRNIDTLVLGCTHYPFLYKHFKSAAGKKITVLDSPRIVAEKLAEYLDRHPEIEQRLSKHGTNRFVVTDVTERFSENAERWLGQRIELEKIELE